MTRLVCVLGNVRALAPDGAVVDVPSASQRRLLGLLALYTPQRLRTDWLADVLEITPGALRRSVSRLRTVLGSDALVTGTTGYALTCPVDAALFCDEVARAASADDRIATLERAVGMWGGAALEEFAGEDWARGEIARLTEIHGAAVDDLADELISAKRSADAIALLDGFAKSSSIRRKTILEVAAYRPRVDCQSDGLADRLRPIAISAFQIDRHR